MFECHITTKPPVTSEDVQRHAALADEQHWKQSQIAGDPVLGPEKYAYFTCHSPDYDWIRNKMDHLAEVLGDEVLRTKIEYIAWDSRFPDGQ